ncbi:MAG TPA: GNAT family N-acetyltransferase [Opitutaceae bacterium]|nr:GNAT family N-acetyltransferase [Opitutaceae bacterium]
METVTTFKIATTDDEFEQIHRLNYRTFVEEIPQHAPNPDGRQVDRFHTENTYVIGVRDGRVIAQLAVRRRRPFSLDAKLAQLDGYLPHGRNIVEMRLLAVEPGHRNGPVAAQLMQFVAQYCRDRGDDVAVISGAVRQLRLYRALGFEPFGPVVGTADAPYQPMLLTLEKYLAAMQSRRSLQRSAGTPVFADLPPAPVNLLPGPVAVSPAVLAGVARHPVPHRAPEFMAQIASVRRRLAALVRAADVQVMPGSGSLANDVIAAQIAGLGRPGVVVSTGEFGERLADHARRAGLEFHWAKLPWGTPLDRDLLTHATGQVRAPGWIWLVHHETSTGVLHDLAALKEFARDHQLLLCLDCISSIGAVRVDLEGVHLASCVSGKGIASLPGLALVFHQTRPAARPDLPRYLDLGMWAACDGVPFTHSSNLVTALDLALAEVERLPAGRCETGDNARWLRGEFRAAGFKLVADEPHASPIIVTIELPSDVGAEELGARLERRGFLTSHRSGYLAQRTWIQFCLMAAPPRPVLGQLVAAVREVAGELGVPLVRRTEASATTAAASAPSFICAE